MSKATLTFDLDSPDDSINFKRAVYAAEMAGVLFELRYNFMRNLENRLINENADPYEEVRELLNETLEPINELSDTII